MSVTFEKNLSALLSRYPHLKSTIDAAVQKDFRKEFTTKSKDGGLELIEEGMRTDSTAATFSPLKKESVPAKNIVLLGFGLGSQLKSILNSPLKETKEYFIVEPFLERFLFTCTLFDLTKEISNSSIHWFLGLKPKQAYFEMFELFKDFSRACGALSTRFVKHPVLSEVYADYFSEFTAEWEKNLHNIKQYMGSPSDARLGLSNSLANRKFVEENPGIELLKGLFADVPAVIVSTGPSLKKSIEDLKKIQNKAVFLAADASLNVLLSHGIVPHFVLSLEREETTPFFQNLKFPAGMPKANMVAYPLVPPETLAAYDGPKWVAYRSYDYYGYFQAFIKKGFIDSLHSVAHTCLSFAEYIGCTDVSFVGQDLSYDPVTLASHPEGISYEKWSLAKTEEQLKKEAAARGEEMFWVPGNLAEKVPTSSYYLLYLQEFIMLFRRSPLKFTNCTNGGAKLGEIPWKPLAEHSKNWKEHSDLFERISQKEWDYVASQRIDFNPAKGALSDFHLKIKDALKLADQKPSLDTVAQLLTKKAELLEERAFHAFVLVQMLRTIVGIEQKWNLLHEDDKEVFAERHSILKEWFEEVEKSTAATIEVFKQV